MAGLWDAVTSTFWSEWFWLPRDSTWEVFNNKDDGIYRAQTGDIIIMVPLTVLVIVLRQLFERYISKPVGRHFGLREEECQKAPPNEKLESFYAKNQKPNDEHYLVLGKQTDLSRRQIERWFRQRRNQDRTKTLIKFSESSWRCAFYFIIFWYGVYVLHDEEFVWDRRDLFRNWPDHHVNDELFWYYAIEAAFYMSLLFTLFTDVKRKDFLEMIIHHICTLGLMFTSYCGNLLRIGSLVLVVHDVVDSSLEATKMLKYLAIYDKKYQNHCDRMFVLFFLLWVLTRLIIYPIWVVYSAAIVSLEYFETIPLYWFINGMLITLQILHIFWSVIIFKIVVNTLRAGKLEKDERSDSDMELSDTNETVWKLEGDTRIIQNGINKMEKRVARATSNSLQNSHS